MCICRLFASSSGRRCYTIQNGYMCWRLGQTRSTPRATVSPRSSAANENVINDGWATDADTSCIVIQALQCISHSTADQQPTTLGPPAVCICTALPTPAAGYVSPRRRICSSLLERLDDFVWLTTFPRVSSRAGFYTWSCMLLIIVLG